MAHGDSFYDQFRKGHLIFGIRSARETYIEVLAKCYQSLDFYIESPENCVSRLTRQYAAAGDFLTCDEYLARTIRGELPSDTESNIKFNVANNQNPSPFGPPRQTPVEKAATAAFYERLEESKYSSLKATKTELQQAIRKGNRNIANLVMRRACKFGLQYGMETGRTVHFILDGPGKVGSHGNRIDNEFLIRKEKLPGIDVPVTTSELLFCYRNPHFYETGKLKFYLDYREVPAPWISRPDLWEEYRIHREQKRAGGQ